jgi:hypothetical protein
MWTGASPSTRAILPLPCQSKVEHLPFAAFEYVVEVQGIFQGICMFFRGSFEADLLWYFHPLELGKLQFWKY